jgi:hypothetical protein
VTILSVLLLSVGALLVVAGVYLLAGLGAALVVAGVLCVAAEWLVEPRRQGGTT